MYPQRQEGLYMQRIPVFAGYLTPHQLHQLADIAIKFTQNTPLHLTTRQDIELHNVPTEHLRAVQEQLNELRLETFGAGGDSVRNITVCPCCGFSDGGFDIQPLAQQVRDFLHNSILLNNMPRKFKISLAGCSHPQSKPFVNDLAFIATSSATVRVIGAGSLGPRPETGIVLFESLPIGDVLPLTAAALKLFVDHGERENRRKARLRHIRQRLGNAAFLDLLNDYFRRETQSRDWPTLELKNGSAGWNHQRLQVINGDLEVGHAQLLARAAADQDAQLRINLTHSIEIYSRQPFDLPEPLKPLTDLPCIVACPGSTTCTNGLTNCPQAAAKLAQWLKGNPKLAGKTIALSGCPNNCAHSSIADIGLSGMVKTIDGQRQEVYQVYLDGGNGTTEKLAERNRIVSIEELPQLLRDL
jgi:sulfite reductase (ferredoxin)